MTDLHDRVESLLLDEGLDPMAVKIVMILVDKFEEAAREREAEEVPEPASMEAMMLGCTCRLSTVGSTDIDPPYVIQARDCPLHGKQRDPDDARDQQAEDRAWASQFRGTPFVYDRDD